MRHRLFLVLALLYRLQAPSYAVDTLAVESPEPLLAEWRWQALHSARARITNMWVDTLGVLLTTAAGLETYDGYRWEVMDGPDSLLRSEGHALLRTRNGLSGSGPLAVSSVDLTDKAGGPTPR